ncbi:MAG: ribonuclease HI [Calditrichia bacterium]
MPNDEIIIYTDGACSGNQQRNNKGGWGAIIISGDDEKELWDGEMNTTNNRMEMTACVEALKYVGDSKKTIKIHSDSAYIVNCFKQKWYVNWRRNGWRNASKKPVENRDLWEAMLELVEKNNVTFVKVKGHAGIPLNERADQLANRGIDEL